MRLELFPLWSVGVLRPWRGSSKVCWADPLTQRSEVVIPPSTPIQHGVTTPPPTMLIHSPCTHHPCPVPEGIPQPPDPFPAKLLSPPSAAHPGRPLLLSPGGFPRRHDQTGVSPQRSPFQPQPFACSSWKSQSSTQDWQCW